MNRRTRRTLLVVAAVLIFLAVIIFLRSKAPPEAARLLPESQGIVYVDLKPLRAFFPGKLQPAPHTPEYQQFIDATGMDWERDLDQAAIALHRMPDPNGPNGAVGYSMVLVGKITGNRLNAWLDAHATSREFYAGHTVYSIPSDGRTVRVAQIGYNMVAISNMPTPEQIHSILDRHATAAWPFAGSTLLRQHYQDVPLLSLAWGVGQIGLPFSERGSIGIFGFSLPLEADATLIASLTPALSLKGMLNVKVVEIVAGDAQASSQAAALRLLLSLARNFTAPLASNPANNGLKELLKTAVVKQERNRVVITAALSRSLFSVLADSKNPPAEIPSSPGAPQ
ncbi:MAG: hypothetical protein ACP5FH_04675 [Terracidiphilus sp.]